MLIGLFGTMLNGCSRRTEERLPSDVIIAVPLRGKGETTSRRSRPAHTRR
jgi:hypothetical protein